jgi:hypothetical protein
MELSVDVESANNFWWLILILILLILVFDIIIEIASTSATRSHFNELLVDSVIIVEISYLVVDVVNEGLQTGTLDPEERSNEPVVPNIVRVNI